jgi:hypothetical protein
MEINLKVNLTYGDQYLDDSGSIYLQFVCWGIIIPIISVFGIVGNVLTMIVLWRREMISTSIYFLRALVVTDMIIIIVAVVVLTPFSLAIYTNGMHYFQDVVYPNIYTAFNFLVMTVQQCNVWFTVSMALERYISICHPFQAPRFYTKRRAIITLVLITVVSVFYNIPRVCAATARECPAEEGNAVTVPSADKLCYMLVSTDFGNSVFYKTVYATWMYSILIYIIPLTVLFVFNLLIIMELMRMQRRRIGMNIQEDNETSLTLILVVIVVVFIFCQTPGLIAQFDFFTVPVFMKWLAVSNTLFVLNSAVNFLVYTAVGRRFRNLLRKTMNKCVGENSGIDSTSRTSHMATNGYEITTVPINGNTVVNGDVKNTSETTRLKDDGLRNEKT